MKSAIIYSVIFVAVFGLSIPLLIGHQTISGATSQPADEEQASTPSPEKQNANEEETRRAEKEKVARLERERKEKERQELAKLELEKRARPDCYVLSVGIDRYNMKPLKGCVNDARNAAQTFRQQEGTLFNKVKCTVLVDDQASTEAIEEKIKKLVNVGKPGDVMVLFLSGHGDRRNKQWAFLPQDFTGNQLASTISDESILHMADEIAAQGKKVILMVDACFAGQLRLSAKGLLSRYRDPRGGGIVLMVSSMPNQLSAACGAYSAFAFAVKEGMDGRADYNGDGQVTLQELRRYAYHRVYELQKGDQDGEIDYSLSLSDAMVIAKKGQNGWVADIQSVPEKADAAITGPTIHSKLTAQDPFDRLRKGCRAKVFTIDVAAGQCIIDLTSGDGRPGPHNPGFFDTYLRIEDVRGKVIAENDDHGGTFNSQVTLNITRAGQIRVVVTSFPPGVTGDFQLRIR
jgi:hypothetical protein